MSIANNITLNGATTNGALANTAVSVGSTTQLQGSGTIVGPVTILAGGTLAPGNSIESLGVGDLTYSANSTYAYEMDNDALPAVAGDLTYSSGNLSIASGAILTLTELGSGSWTIGEKLTLISYNGTWNSGNFTYLGNPLADGDTFNFSSASWTIDYDDTVEGTNFTADATGTFVTITVVPEPGAIALAACGLIGLGMAARRRSLTRFCLKTQTDWMRRGFLGRSRRMSQAVSRRYGKRRQRRAAQKDQADGQAEFSGRA